MRPGIERRDPPHRIHHLVSGRCTILPHLPVSRRCDFGIRWESVELIERGVSTSQRPRGQGGFGSESR